MDALYQLDTTIIAAAAFLTSALALILLLVIVVRQSRMLSRYKLLLNGPVGTDLEKILLDQQVTIEQLQQLLSETNRGVANLTAASRLHLQKVAMLRFNAFPDTGSDLSFAIAILDANNDGFVLSNLYGRNESRVYAKPVQAGHSTYALSDEEKQVISQAIGQRSY